MAKPSDDSPSQQPITPSPQPDDQQNAPKTNQASNDLPRPRLRELIPLNLKLPQPKFFRSRQSESTRPIHPHFPKPSLPQLGVSWVWIFMIMGSYTCIGYFLSVLLTFPKHQYLAIASFIVVTILPTLTAFADFALMKWSYLLSGLLIIGGLIFLASVKFELIVLAIVAWVGVTAIAFVGDFLTKKRKPWVVIGILTSCCIIGLGIGHQAWQIAKSWT
ncbi:hypothetical protein [Pseudanabaena mucicola]|uniref:DUF308 domain-containing protein n=1 Tax=Pseudanabaena mucicola FACHB-723 TaxID=2692860 RepID=A0ABR7ZTY2_9CYAN|nr:hypothetical protein [Pseudanabaena mucicola]MBD2187398.1 hypothetical protein [Pseudanabaena mucicola FACHB-723]